MQTNNCEKMRNLYIFLIIYMIPALMFGEDGVYNEKFSSYEGRHFCIGFMQNEIEELAGEHSGHYLELFISSTKYAKITVTANYFGTKQYAISPDSVLRVSFSDFVDDLQVIHSETLYYKVVDVTSDVPITVYAFNSQYTTSDSYAAIPVAHWGTEYVVMSLPNDQYKIPTDFEPSHTDSIFKRAPRQSEFMIIADFDDTRITFKPTSDTEQGKLKGNSYSVTLNKGQCYLVKSEKVNMGIGDLSGTIVRGNKQFGLLSGHVRTSVPQGFEFPKDSKDHLVEMLFPTKAWGKQFVTIPFDLNPHGDLIRIMNIVPNTSVNLQSEAFSGTKTLGAAGSFDDITKVNVPVLWTADNPIQIAQFMRHSGDEFDNVYYDPSMVMIPPVDQFVRRILFQTLGNNPNNPAQFTTHTVLVVCDKEALDYIMLDSLSFDSLADLSIHKISGTDLYWGKYNIPIGKHELVTEKGGLCGVIYGYGHADSYAMVLGAALTDPFLIDSIAPQISVNDDCGKLNGAISDIHGESSSGLDYIFVEEDSCYNYKWMLEEVTDTATYIEFSAWPENIMEDAKFRLNIKDKYGNGRIYEYFYEGLYVNIYPYEIDFGEIIANLSGSFSFSVENRGERPVKILNISLAQGDSRIKFLDLPDFEYDMPVGRTDDYHIEFRPNGDTTDLIDTIIVEFTCDRVFRIPVKGQVISYGLEVSGYDFGEVYIGDTSCAYVFLENKGNVNVELNELNIEEFTGQFDYDTTLVFPIILKPGDSLKIKVCFIPTERSHFSEDGTFLNGLNLKNSFTVAGTGIAPDFNSITIDFGKRRVGTINDTSFIITNGGNTQGTFKFDSFKKDDDNFDKLELENIDQMFDSSESVSFKNSYKPQDAGTHEIIAKYETDWKLHSDINITLRGEGTLPQIAFRDIDFGIVPIFKTKDTTETLISSKGNEDLAISNVAIVGGDPESFILGPQLKSLIDNSSDTVLSIGSDIRELMTFAPKRTGLHELIIEFDHDAAPSYNTIRSQIKLSGESNVATANMELDTPIVVIACQEGHFLDVSIENTGTIDIDLQEWTLTATGISAKWADDYPDFNSGEPVTIPVGETLRSSIEIFAKNGESGTISVEAVIGDTITHIETYFIEPVVMPIIINDPGKIVSMPGDSLSITLSGSFPYKVDVVNSLFIDVFIDNKCYELTSGAGKIKINEGGDIRTYDVGYKQEIDRIKVEFSDSFEINQENTEWSFNLPLRTLLNVEQNPEIVVYADSPDCYLSDSLKTNAIIEDICVNPIRNIQRLWLPEIEIYPNPISNKLKLNIKLYENDELNIDLIDNSGKKFTLSSNLYLIKGSHSLIFEITDMTSGVYVLSVHTSQQIRNKLIIINK